MDASWHGAMGVEVDIRLLLKTCPVSLEAEQEERPSDPGVRQVTRSVNR